MQKEKTVNDYAENALASRLKDGFDTEFGRCPSVVSRAPGRLEILGNHTDYNEGVVLSAAVDHATYFAASVNDADECHLYDLRENSRRSFSINDIAAGLVPDDWANYVKGIIVELQNRGFDVPGFDACILSDIPMSAGMSSSAALEMAAAYGIGEMATIELPWIEWAKIGQQCENKTVGANTGLMDQFSSIRGQRDHLVFSDFRSLDTSTVPLAQGFALVVANSMVKHDLTGDYNERRNSCENAAQAVNTIYPEVSALRDVNSDMLNKCKGSMDSTAFSRALHVVGENERVNQGVKALEKGDIMTFGKLMYESHESSRVNFENSCPELDFLVETGKTLPGAVGARLSGGGFGGITVHLVEENKVQEYTAQLSGEFSQHYRFEPDTMICHAGDGAQVLS